MGLFKPVVNAWYVMCAYGRPHLSFCPIALHTLVSSLDEYADGCLFAKGSD